MKTIKKVTIEPVFVDEFIPPDSELEENKIYISKKYGTAIHWCLCGCKLKVVMPIDAIIEGKDHGWQLIEEKDDKVSFTPSVGNFQYPCKSHYIITKNIANFV